MQRWLAVGALALLAVPAHAQGRITAAIRGTVTDPTQAVVSGAKVTVTGEDTGYTQTATTNADGIYIFNQLVVGNYRVAVEAKGFKAITKSRIELNVDETRVVDFQLQTGDITEVVTVETGGLAVQTAGGDVSALVNGEQVRELPLNGRNFMELAIITPGAAAKESIQSNTVGKGLLVGSDVSFSGSGVTSNLWLVDGANNVDVGSGRTILVYPSADAIEEFKIENSNYGAEFGQASGGVVNIVTKSGTNDFHGSGYFFARRDGLDGANYFTKAAPPLDFNDYGGSLGGPVIKDKLQFFGSYEKNDDNRTEIRAAQVPTQGMDQGNFNNPGACAQPAPINPFTGQPFPGNVIPQSMWSPAAQAVLALFPAPNTTPTGGSCNNWVAAVPTPITWWQGHGRVDWTLSDSTRLMVRYTHDSWVDVATATQGLWGEMTFPTIQDTWNSPGQILVAQLNSNLGTQMVNSLTFSYSANAINIQRSAGQGVASALQSAIPTLFPCSGKTENCQGIPGFNWGSLGPYANPIWEEGPWKNNEALYVVKDDFSAVFGKHFVKAGLLGSYNEKNQIDSNTSQLEEPFFNGVYGEVNPASGAIIQKGTGNAIADLLLNNTLWNTYEEVDNPYLQVRWQDYEAYLQDSYKASSKLTVDAGLRLSHFTWPYLANDQLGAFWPASATAAAGNSPCNGVLYPPGKNPCPALGLAGGSDGPDRGLFPQAAVLFQPRVGFAYDVNGDGKSSIRGGVGWFFNRAQLNPPMNQGQIPPFAGSTTYNRTLVSAANVLNPTTTLGYGSPSAGFCQDCGDYPPNNWNWNLSYSREIVKNTTLQLAYVGSKGANAFSSYNANEIPVSERGTFALTNNPALRPLNGIAGISNGPLPEEAFNQNSIYHGLQVQLTSRFGHGSQFQVNYTFSKNIANTDLTYSGGGGGTSYITDTTDPGLYRFVQWNSRTHVFNANLVLALPSLEGQSGFVKNVFGDWELTSIVTATTGYPLGVNLGGANGIPGGITGTGTSNSIWPNVVPGQSCSISSASNPVQWLNPAAYTVNGMVLGQNGNASPSSCVGPGWFDWDLALYKNIHLGSRVKLQLRVEAFNILNSYNWIVGSLTNGGTVSNYSPQSPVVLQGNTIVSSAGPNSNFGQFTQTGPERQVQLGARITF